MFFFLPQNADPRCVNSFHGSFQSRVQSSLNWWGPRRITESKLGSCSEWHSWNNLNLWVLLYSYSVQSLSPSDLCPLPPRYLYCCSQEMVRAEGERSEESQTPRSGGHDRLFHQEVVEAWSGRTSLAWRVWRTTTTKNLCPPFNISPSPGILILGNRLIHRSFDHPFTQQWRNLRGVQFAKSRYLPKD